MEIHSAAIVGRYCEALVIIPQYYEGDTADITFTFSGEGGSFNNIVRFRAIGSRKFCLPVIAALTARARAT